MSARRVAFFGGNGHCAARLAGARDAADRLVAGGAIPPLEVLDVPYPGFEGRPRAGSLDAFLAELARHASGASLVYATGIGGLLALCLRARGELGAARVLLQAPVLWGLERRLMPRLMRLGPARWVVHRVFAASAFQAFVRRHFARPLAPQERAAFFDGYARCVALPDLFAWLAPALLRTLERQLARWPEAFERIEVWWGRRDRVVTPHELVFTEKALGVSWPLRSFEEWGHYPMIDAPEAWVRALSEALEAGLPI